ncbi:alpha-1,2-mannosidase, putative [Streptomyces sp. DvalAA-14]|uniref:GH92 family glycosyl hydrolase n=1 Tax=unclassified Streptomyces TaxID=2593676 RepID=UPI00081B7817|nr:MULTISPECIES: lectin [unclassified Streptomyces]MYS22093.1 glycoside hydrolase family 92 protein [Streptomyces sp. SID4948]SCE08558.1 alpha-1,2-mannosidase, putative [Streptomyces sp. DvalAA-14]
MVGPQRLRAPRISSRFRRRLAVVSVLGMVVLPLQSLAGADAATGPQLVTDPAALINPLIGTSGAVNTFPGPDMPFGMMQWGPDTTPARAQGGGYEYKSTKISGYSLTHVSGPGCDVAGDVPILPVTGALSGNLSDLSTQFSHDDEQTGVGYYGVTDSQGVTTELTDTTRAGLGRFTFPAGAQSNLLLKLSGGATQVDGTRVRVVSNREVSGSVDSGHFCGADNRYTLHFDIKFNQPFTGSGTWVGSTINPDAKALSLGRPQQKLATHPNTPLHEQHFTVPGTASPTVHPSGSASATAARGGSPAARSAAAAPPVTGANGMYLTFDTSQNAAVTAAVGISYTSDDNAAGNLSTEVKGWNVDAMRKANHAAWNDILGKVQIGGGSQDQQVQFYTALYHALLHPNVFSDDNGQYMGMDDQVHKLTKGQKAQYANYSAWDTYRSQTQLISMVAPQQTGDIVTSMLNGYDQTGLLPKWASNNGESYVMVGDPAASIIADAYAFGVRNFDAAHALDAMEHEATAPNQDRPGESVRDAKGYLPLDGTYGCCNFYGPVSTQLEYDSADYALAAFAKSQGKTADYQKFATRAQDWMNVFNPQTGYLQGKNADGQFAGAFTPGTSNGFVEGTSAQYTPMVPFDLQQLITARGGTAAYSSYLDSLLSDITDPSGTNADLSNEPSLEIPWEYNYVGQPWKTQAAVRQAQQKLYFNAPVGSFGNDDLGAMSSWYVWSELGMYPETPGTDTLVLGSPAFPTAKITLGNGKQVAINAPQAAPDAPYVQALDVKGKAYNSSWLTFAQFEKAGTLDYSLNTVPNTSWASSADAAPPSDATGGGRVLAATGPTSDGLIVAPGASADATLRLTNLGTKAVTVDWAATVPAGVTLGASSGSLTVPPSGSAEAKVPVTAGDTEGSYAVTFALTDHSSGAALTGATLRVAVAQPGELWPYESNEGIFPDAAHFSGGFDDGGWAYSQNAMTAAGISSGAKVTADGIDYTWPTIAAGRPDNLEVAGQTLPQPAGTSGAFLGLLGSATNAPTDGSGVPGAITVTYTDGSTAKATVTFSDWTLNGGSSKPVAGNTTAVTTDYRNTADGGKDTVKAYVFSVKVPLDAAKTVASVTLPVTGASGTVHLFALGIGG